MDKQQIKVLMIEDSADDELLIVRELKKGGFDPFVHRVWNGEGLQQALTKGEWDCILSDHQMPDFDVFRALKIVKETEKDIPFIIVSGAIGEEKAVEAMKAGAHDFIDKNRMSRLCVAIRREMKEAEERFHRRKAEEALKAKTEEIISMTQQLWQAAKLATMGELTASVAHELNNPLTTLTLTVESMIDRLSPDDPIYKSVEIIRSELNRMASLVSNLLNYSRKLTPKFSALDVREEIKTSLALVGGHLRSHNVSVDTEFENNVPMVVADSQQLRQIFLNLITNAVDAMPMGGNLLIRVKKGETNGLPAVVIEFEDNGIGIPADVLPKVMEPFYTSKPEGKGTGLGLSICRRIVEEHQGEIHITSEVGKGTLVRVSFPVALGVYDPNIPE